MSKSKGKAPRRTRAQVRKAKDRRHQKRKAPRNFTVYVGTEHGKLTSLIQKAKEGAKAKGGASLSALVVDFLVGLGKSAGSRRSRPRKGKKEHTNGSEQSSTAE